MGVTQPPTHVDQPRDGFLHPGKTSEADDHGPACDRLEGSDPASHRVGDADAGIRNLTVLDLAAQLPGELDDLGDTGGADRVTLGEQASADVDRDDLVEQCPTLLGETERLRGEHLADRERIMDLGHVDVRRRDPGGLIGSLPRGATDLQPREVRPLVHRAARRKAGAQDPHRSVGSATD